jgi:hypothetical protein
VTRRSYSGTAVPTILSAGIGALDLTFTVQDATGYPDGTDGPFFVTLARGIAGEEKVLCDSRSGLTFTVNAAGRGADGTVATAHAASSTTVEHTITKTDLDEANAHVNQTGSADDPHPQYLTDTDASAAYATKAETGQRSFGAPSLGPGRGAPVRGVLATYWPVWLLDATTDEGAGIEFTVPQGWSTMSVDAVAANAGTGTGNYRLRLVFGDVAAGDTLSVTATSGVTVAAGSQNVVQVTEVLADRPVTPGRTFLLMLERLGGHAEDTVANDIGLLNLVVRKTG